MAEENIKPAKKRRLIKPSFFIWLIILALVVIAGFSSFYVVDETENAVITRFGKYTQTVGSGLHVKLPFGIDKNYNVDIRLYDIIYKMIEDIENSMKGLLDPVFEEEIIGHAEIRQIFKFSKIGNIAGCHVTDGVMKNNYNARLIRDGIVIYTGKIKSIQHEKDQVKEMKKDMDCGITLENFQDIKELDVIECYELKEIKR